MKQEAAVLFLARAWLLTSGTALSKCSINAAESRKQAWVQMERNTQLSASLHAFVCLAAQLCGLALQHGPASKCSA